MSRCVSAFRFSRVQSLSAIFLDRILSSSSSQSIVMCDVSCGLDMTRSREANVLISPSACFTVAIATFLLG